MHEATIGDRASVERLYPREDFERDAGENAAPMGRSTAAY